MKQPPIRWAAYASPLGAMTLAATSAGLCGVWFDGQQHFDGPAADWQPDPSDPVLFEVASQLDDWFARRRQAFDLPLDPRRLIPPARIRHIQRRRLAPCIREQIHEPPGFQIALHIEP